MRAIDRKLVAMKMWAQHKVSNFVNDEEGDVNIVSMVVLIGIAVLLAVLFKDAIKELIETLLGTISQNAQEAVN